MVCPRTEGLLAYRALSGKNCSYLVDATSGHVAVHPVDMVSSLRFHSDPSASYCGHYDFFCVHPESPNRSKVASCNRWKLFYLLGSYVF